MVGRDDELRLFSDLVQAGDRRGVVLAGPAGVGKTRLAGECLAGAERSGFATARAAATRCAAALPFGAFAALLPATGDHAGLARDQPEFLRRCCETLTERAEGRRLVLFVDDAHLLDEASAALLHQVAQVGTAFVIVTLRTGEPAPDAVAALWKDGLTERIDIGPLPVSAVSAVLVAALGGPVERATVARLAARSEGNALFLRELIMGARQAGALREQDGRWRLVGSPPPSDRLVELIEVRLANLADPERAFLELVALGEPLGTADVEALGDPALADSLERQGLLTSRSDGQRLAIRLAHPLYGEVLQARLPAVRGRMVLRSLADALEATGLRRREDSLRFARWRLDAGGDVHPDLMAAAAKQARRLFDFEMADRLIRRAVEAGAGFDAELFLAELLFVQGHYEDAEEHLVGLLPDAREEEHRARIALLRIDTLELAGRGHEALAVIADAESAIRDPAWRDQLTSKRALIALMAGSTAEATNLVEPLLERLRGEALIEACFTATFAFGLSGRTDEAVEAAELGLAAHRNLAVPAKVWYPAVHPLTQVRVLHWAGRLAEAQALAARCYEEALSAAADEPRSWFAVTLGECYREQGRGETATRWVREAIDLARPLGRTMYFRNYLIILAQTLTLAGRATEAENVVAEIDAMGAPSIRWEEAQLGRARAWIAVAKGERRAADGLLVEAVETAARGGELVLESAALHDRARLGHAREVASRLRELAGIVEGPLAPARAAHGTALAAADAPGLEAASRAFEELGALLLAAEAAADAAAVLRKMGDLRKAAAAERRAGTLAAHCEGAVTPALAWLSAQPGLTPAERDVAVLAAAGRSNPEIAGALFLSRKTVENYLSHVYQKLGISSRAELAGALDDRTVRG
jgi:ATP/maltotriose-dependent transcriptional regulator MalT